jgi:hypothetical protein
MKRFIAILVLFSAVLLGGCQASSDSTSPTPVSAPPPQSVWYLGEIKGAHPTWTARAKNLTGRPQTLSLCAMKGIGEAPNFDDDKGKSEAVAQPGQEISLGPVTAQACGRIEIELKAETCATHTRNDIMMDAEIYEIPCPSSSPTPTPPPCEDFQNPCPGRIR